jgi:predicted MFS family arabinose efflux permease
MGGSLYPTASAAINQREAHGLAVAFGVRILYGLALTTTEKLELTPRQWAITLLIAAVQFVNILDFVIVMPMGPLFAKALGIAESHLGYVNGSYTAAAGVTGLLGALFLDRFDRRKALGLALFGLVLGTLAGGFATDLPTLLLARVVAGAFGGPATSLSFSIIADTIPVKVRGRAMGAVMGAFSVASVFGVPLGLFLAETYGWQAPFFAVATVGALVALFSIKALPPMRGHLEHARPPVSLFALVLHPRPLPDKVEEARLREAVTLVRLSYLMTAVVMMAGFVIIPTIAPYLRVNLGLPQSSLKWAYGFGGVASFFSTQLGGRLVDRFGSFRVGTAGALLVIGVVFTMFYLPWTSAPAWVVYLCFIAFMMANGLRNVSYNTLTSKVPAADVRARFQSLQSSVQHFSSALAAWGSAQLLTTVAHAWPDDPTREPRLLVGMNHVALVSMGLSLAIPGLLFAVERRVKARGAARLALGVAREAA